MSNIFKNMASGGGLPPTVPTSFVTDVNSPAIPAANILNVIGGQTTANNDKGIRTDGSSGSNIETIQLTNRLQGTATTVGAANANVITFTPTVVGTYSIELRVAAYNTTSFLGAGYSLFGAVRFDGVNSNLCDTFDPIDNEEGTMTNTMIDVVVSAAAINLQVTGYVSGVAQTINWSAVGLYTFVGA